MLNFYRRFIAGAAESQARLNDFLICSKKKNNKRAIKWSTNLLPRLTTCKALLCRASTLAFPSPNSKLWLVEDVHETAALHQVFFVKLNTAPKSTYDRELLTAYSAVKYFKHLFEGRMFAYMDHKVLIFAFWYFHENYVIWTTFISLQRTYYIYPARTMYSWGCTIAVGRD